MKEILDPCCGSKMFYFDKFDDRVLTGDIRRESHILCDGRVLNIAPDELMDFTELKFPDKSFSLIVFDPPHLVSAGKNSWLFKKYGKLNRNWEHHIKAGFSECWRVLRDNGTLIFKWNETQIQTKKILAILPQKPVFGHTSGRAAKTVWMTFFKM